MPSGVNAFMPRMSLKNHRRRTRGRGHQWYLGEWGGRLGYVRLGMYSLGHGVHQWYLGYVSLGDVTPRKVGA